MYRIVFLHVLVSRANLKKNASAGNRTRAARVAGEHSTTEPPMQVTHPRISILYIRWQIAGINILFIKVTAKVNQFEVNIVCLRSALFS